MQSLSLTIILCSTDVARFLLPPSNSRKQIDLITLLMFILVIPLTHYHRTTPSAEHREIVSVGGCRKPFLVVVEARVRVGRPLARRSRRTSVRLTLRALLSLPLGP